MLLDFDKHLNVPVYDFHKAKIRIILIIIYIINNDI